MIDFLVLDTATDEDAAKYFRALRLAQRDIDVEPERYKHYLLEELPEKYHSMLDIRRCGIGEGLVFEPVYSGGIRADSPFDDAARPFSR